MNKIHYCPISPVQRQFGLYVTGAGHELTKPGEQYPHKYHSSDYYFTWQKGRTLADWEYQLLYIRDGRGTIQFKRGKSIAIGGGTVIILHPGEWHRYRPDPKTGWSEAYIGIGGEFFARIVSKPFFPQAPAIIRISPNGRFDHDLVALVEKIQKTSTEHYSLALREPSCAPRQAIAQCDDPQGEPSHRPPPWRSNQLCRSGQAARHGLHAVQEMLPGI